VILSVYIFDIRHSEQIAGRCVRLLESFVRVWSGQWKC